MFSVSLSAIMLVSLVLGAFLLGLASPIFFIIVLVARAKV